MLDEGAEMWDCGDGAAGGAYEGHEEVGYWWHDVRIPYYR